MASFTIIESAVKSGLTTYKAIVEQLCQQNADLAATLLEQVSLKEDDPKILRKKYRAEQVEKFKDDKQSINDAMKAYDVSFKTANPDAKPKRVPPVRKWTEEDKAFTKAKNAYLKVEKAKLSDSLTVAEMKKQVKALGDAYTKAHKKPKSDESDDEHEEQLQAEPLQESDNESDDDAEPVQAEVQAEAEESDNESDDDAEPVQAEVQAEPVQAEPDKAAKKAAKQAKQAEKQAKQAENERRRALKAAKAEKAKAKAEKAIADKAGK
jgi:hypothetical protein